MITNLSIRKHLQLATLLVAAATSTAFAAPEKSPNVLFIAVDDLNHWVGYLGRNSQTQTPNIDRLAKRGVWFTRSYCAAPVCNPSRAAVMSGLRPGVSGIYDNSNNFQPVISEELTLTTQFRKAGYFVCGAGKIFHDAVYRPGEWDDWLKGRKHVKGAEEDGAPLAEVVAGKLPITPLNCSDEEMPDYAFVDYAIAELSKTHDKPFFVACGLSKPHLPWSVPKKYYDKFPLETIQLPPFREGDLDDLPPIALKLANSTGDHKAILQQDGTNTWKQAIQAYLATINFCDAMVGRLLDAYDKSPERDNTIICFWSDHGWHLGEKQHWRKSTLWEEAARAPHIWVVPGLTKPDSRCDRTIDYMSIYPTLMDLCGLPKPSHVKGGSIRELLAKPNMAWNQPAITTFRQNNHSLRSEGWRYTRYSDGGEEFYNETVDPYEWTNLAKTGGGDPSAKAALLSHLPRENNPPAGGRQGDSEPKKAKTSVRPNVLFIIADDASRHFGAYGCTWVKTPNIDSLAKQGLVFDNAYTPTSKCAPSRASILTGRNPWQLEEAANHQPFFPAKFIAFSEALDKAGIACGSAGKTWGPGEAKQADGRARDFALRGNGVVTDRAPGSDLTAFLKTRTPGQPFFYWFGSRYPHRSYKLDSGLAAGKKTTDIDRVPAYLPDHDIVRRDMLDYAVAIEAFDAQVGSLLEALEASGEAKKTLIVVTSDNGMPFPRVKGHTYDEAHRMPFVVSWPESIAQEGRRISDFVSFIDLAPTFLDVLGVNGITHGMAPITGRSFADLLRGEVRKEQGFAILGRERNDTLTRPGSPSGLGYPSRALREGNWFYVRNFAPERWPCGNPELAFKDTDSSPTKTLVTEKGEQDMFWQYAFGKRPAEELFDLSKDPDCVTNLASLPELAMKLSALRDKLMTELKRQNDPRALGQGNVFDQYPAVLSNGRQKTR